MFLLEKIKHFFVNFESSHGHYTITKEFVHVLMSALKPSLPQQSLFRGVFCEHFEQAPGRCCHL